MSTTTLGIVLVLFSVAVEGKLTTGLWAEALSQLLRSLSAVRPEPPKASHAARA